MEITIHEDPNISDTEIYIVCPQMTEELRDMIANLGLIGYTVAGKKEGETFFVSLKDIFYFESVDGSIFFYTKEDTYEAAARLYKIEEWVQNLKFARISKTVIVNLRKLQSIKQAEHSRLVATLINGEKLVVSRQYVPEIKKKLGV